MIPGWTVVVRFEDDSLGSHESHFAGIPAISADDACIKMRRRLMIRGYKRFEVIGASQTPRRPLWANPRVV